MQLLLLGTAGCHLCEQAEEIVRVCLTDDMQLILIDIAEQTEWQADYALRIPVLYHPTSQHELAWRFIEQDVIDFLALLK